MQRLLVQDALLVVLWPPARGKNIKGDLCVEKDEHEEGLRGWKLKAKREGTIH